VAQYWSHKTDSQESLFQEVLQTMQEKLGRTYYACYQGLLQVQERWNSENNFCVAKKVGKKPNPAKQSFAQLSKKLDKLEKTLKKAAHKSKKCHRDSINSDSD
jgi:hypothetical protein